LLTIEAIPVRRNIAFMLTGAAIWGILQGDRFIPKRGGLDLNLAHFNLTGENLAPRNDSTPHLEVASPSKEAYKRQLAQRLLQGIGDGEGRKILAFCAKAPEATRAGGADAHLRELFSANAGAADRHVKRHFRHIPASPERILDAPDIIDDYYLNLLDWSSNNEVAVALGSAVYLWNAASGEVQQLMQAPADSDDYITSVAWAGDGKHVAIGTSAAEVQIWDAASQRQVRLPTLPALSPSLALHWGLSALHAVAKPHSHREHAPPPAQCR
jgi:cell division cycle protein 20 (cofactor of APC complex)